MAGMSPTQLTIRKLKSEGFETVQVVECGYHLVKHLVIAGICLEHGIYLQLKMEKPLPYRLLPNLIYQHELRKYLRTNTLVI